MTFHTTDGLRPIAPVALTRRAIGNEIERLIAMLDAMDPDPDLEDDGSTEPWLAGLPTCDEPGDCDRELDASDDEHSLSLTEDVDQERRLIPIPGVLNVDEGEQDINDQPEGDDEREPDFGWCNPMAERATRDEGGLAYSRDGWESGLDFQPWQNQGGRRKAQALLTKVGPSRRRRTFGDVKRFLAAKEART